MNKFFEQFNNIKVVNHRGIIKGYKNGLYGEAHILLDKEINNKYSLDDFQTDRINLIDSLSDKFSNFTTELV